LMMRRSLPRFAFRPLSVECGLSLAQRKVNPWL
jgi:hypothetical protein